MVVECVARPGRGGLAFISEFVEESLRSSANLSSFRPWVIVEAPDHRRIFVAGMPTALRMAVADGQILWVRVQDDQQVPEILNLLLESGLCSGVVLRGYETSGQKNLQLWARRWQLELERTGTHLLWWHEEVSDVILGRMLKVQFEAKQEKAKFIKLLRGWGMVKDSGFECIENLTARFTDRISDQNEDKNFIFEAGLETDLNINKGEDDYGQSGSPVERTSNRQTA